MPATPKPPGQRVRRNKNQNEWRTLPAESGLKAPKLPYRKPAWRKATRDKWERLWASPMASTFEEADRAGLERLAVLWEEIERGQVGNGRLSAVQVLEDRFGLSPKARRALQWEVSKGADVEEHPAAAKAPARRRLRAVAND